MPEAQPSGTNVLSGIISISQSGGVDLENLGYQLRDNTQGLVSARGAAEWY